jgi:hypothetical protein
VDVFIMQIAQMAEKQRVFLQYELKDPVVRSGIGIARANELKRGGLILRGKGLEPSSLLFDHYIIDFNLVVIPLIRIEVIEGKCGHLTRRIPVELLRVMRRRVNQMSIAVKAITKQ